MKKALGFLFVIALFAGFCGTNAVASDYSWIHDHPRKLWNIHETTGCEYYYQGQVQTRAKNKPVKYAKIKIKGVTNPDFVEKLNSGEQGVFTFCQSDYEDGDYLITAKKSGYEQARFLLTILNDWGTIDFTMEMDKIGHAPDNKGEISGIVIEEFYEPYEIWVLIKGTSKTNYNDFTIIYDDQYRFKFKNLKPDVYTLTFKNPDEEGGTGLYYKKVIDLKKNMKCDIIIKYEDFIGYEDVVPE